MRILIVDGSNLLFQMFFGMPARIVNDDGRAIHGTLGFTGALLKIIRMTKPTHIAVLFDGEHENARSELLPEYKANRPDYSMTTEDKTPFSQFPDICAALDFLGIKYTETIDCETDDIIAAYALTYGQADEIVISSFDSDFFQLITENVSVLRYRGEKTVVCTPKYIRDKFGIAPAQYADLKSLTGDAADNIKGAHKIGAKTAAALLNEFGTLDNILTNAERITKPSVKSSVINSAERIKINYSIIKLDNSAALPFKIDELEYSYSGISTNEVLRGIGLK